MRWLLLILLFSRVHAWEVEQVSHHPRIYVIHDFLSAEECDYLIEYAKPHLKRSTIINPVTGLEEVHPTRISFSMRCSDQHDDPLLLEIENRIAEVTTIPTSRSENINIIKYETGGEYRPHVDYFPSDSKELENGGQRIATFLIYLNHPESGGETKFPTPDVSITPIKGEALFFYNLDENGAVDPSVIHGAAPVFSGEKWVVTRFLARKNDQSRLILGV